ncbi:hypothetical protein [Klebsiella michiganensis]|uniref:DNA replication protein n=1 Tax=Raoultella ornithinolytica TaxID=54291 RepID=A0A7G9A7U1_RAOOR|nr:hypothetical protein [Klebsiella michiganensis]QMV82079.1 hypothetical protein [Leclercia sp.]QNL32820.1 DNA replication protein [Raoultella ornithinolytica]
MGSCAAPSAKGDDKFITTDYLQQCRQDRMKNIQLPIISAPDDLFTCKNLMRANLLTQII